MATDDMAIPQHVGISEAPRDVEAIKKQEKAALLPHWDSGVAFKLGYNLRTRLLTFERPAVVDISTISTPGHVLFHAVSTMINFVVERRRYLCVRDAMLTLIGNALRHCSRQRFLG
jgi:uncharacterized protein (UPF0303 family)